MESQPQNPEFRDNPENFHPCNCFVNFFLCPRITTEVNYLRRFVDKYGAEKVAIQGLLTGAFVNLSAFGSNLKNIK